MPPSFSEYQKQIQNEIDQGNQEVAQSAESVSEAAEQMQTASQQERQTTRMLTESIRSQQRQIQALAQSVRQLTSATASQPDPSPTGMRRAPVSTDTPGPGEPVLEGADDPADMPSPAASSNNVIEGAREAGGFAKFAGQEIAYGAAGRLQKWGGESVQSAKQAYGGLTHRPAVPTQGASHRQLRSNRTTIGATKDLLAYDPSSASQYSRGAYERAVEEGAGRTTQNIAGGIAGMGTGAFQAAGSYAAESLASSAIASTLGVTPSTAGGLMSAGTIATGGTLAVGAAGGYLGMKADKYFNPLHYGYEEAQRGRQLSAPATRMGELFLRGRRGRYQKRLGFQERARLSESLREQTYQEKSLSTDEMQTIQKNSIQGHGFWGVQSGAAFAERFEQRMDQAKTIMKTFQKSAGEAAQIMSQMHEQMGASQIDHTANLITQTAAASTMGAQSVGQATQRAMQGAQAAQQQGLMSRTGANVSMNAQQLAGSSTHLSYNLLSSVGGEKGLSKLIQGKQLGYLSGMGGTMLAAGGQYDTLEQGLTQTGQSINSESDLINLMSNRHQMVQKKVDQLGGAGIQAQQASHLADMAQKIAPDQNTKKTMRALMGGGPKAEAFVKSMDKLPDKIKRQIYASSRARTDMKKDLLAEEYSITGRITGGFRSAMSNLGAEGVAQGLSRAKGEIGGYASDKMREITEGIQGYSRTRYTVDEAQNLKLSDQMVKDLSSGSNPGGRDQLRAMMSSSGESSKFYKKILDDPTLFTGKEDYAKHKNLNKGNFMGKNESNYNLHENALAVGATAAMMDNKTIKSRSKLVDYIKGLSEKEYKKAKKRTSTAIDVAKGGRANEQNIMANLGLAERQKTNKTTTEDIGNKISKTFGISGYDQSTQAMLARNENFIKLMKNVKKVFKKVRKNDLSPVEVEKLPSNKAAVQAYEQIMQSGNSDLINMTKEALKEYSVSIKMGKNQKYVDVLSHKNEVEAKRKVAAVKSDNIKGGRDIKSNNFLYDDVGLSKTHQKAEKIQQSKQGRQAVKASLQMVGQATGLKGLGDSMSKGEIRKEIKTLKGLNKEGTKKRSKKVKKLLNSKNKTQRQLGKLLVSFKENQKISGLKEGEAITRLLAQRGAPATAGSGIKTKKDLIDKIGSENLKSMTKVNSKLVDTLKEVSETMKKIRQ
ncbi:MAG: hypothetical protein ABEN55_20790 [Bradymonadaceae bacterium]